MAHHTRKLGLIARLGGVMALMAACTTVPADPNRVPIPTTSAPAPIPAGSAPRTPVANTPDGAARNFVTVIRHMEPIVEQQCLARRTQPINCDYKFVVDDRAGLPINAFQTQDERGRPIIGFTLSLIAEARNADELAFVVGHEAAHHVLNHIQHKSTAATAGALILGGLASVSGGNIDAISAAQNMGAEFGSRYYSKEWELQADYMGTIITKSAGYDPVVGSQFFARIPDPGNQILGTHPSRAQRMEQVNRAVRDMNAGRVR